MKVARLTLVALVAGCAGRMPEPRSATMVRSFHGTLVPGYYVSPAAYQHYIQAQLLSNDGRAEEAAEELRHALASDGASPYLRTRLAEELLTLGRLDDAAAQLDQAWQRSGELKDVERLVRVDLAAGREEAARALLDSLDDEGGAAERRVQVGWLRLLVGQPDRARSNAEEVLRGGE